MASLRLDHLAVVARTLDEGSAHIADQLGIDMPDGGAHPAMGTHNRVVSLGSDRYLEVIAIDPDGARPDRPRWFDLDRFDGEPRLATWVVATDDIEATLATSLPASGRVISLSRGELRWRISIADDGSLPLDGAYPTVIEWPPGPHPAGAMVDLGCRLRSLAIQHPDAAVIDRFIDGRLDRDLVDVAAGPAARLTAEFDTPAGRRTLT